MSVKEHVMGRSYFQFYKQGNLYYKTDTGVEFHIPISDTNDATFEAEDKSIFFMRWIRKTLEMLSSVETSAEVEYHKSAIENDKD